MVDLIVLLILAVYCVRGYRRGMVLNLAALGALAVAVVVSGPLGPVVGAILRSNWSPAASNLVGRTIAGVAIYIPLLVLAHVVDRVLGRSADGELRSWNRGWGLACGIVTGLVVALVLLFLVDLAVKVLPPGESRLVEIGRRSILRKRVSALNPADRFLVTDTLRLVRRAREDPAVRERARAHPQLRKIIEHPRLRPLVEDEELVEALRAYRVEAVLANEKVREALADDELRDLLAAPETLAAIRQVLGEKNAASSAAEGGQAGTTPPAQESGPVVPAETPTSRATGAPAPQVSR